MRHLRDSKNIHAGSGLLKINGVDETKNLVDIKLSVGVQCFLPKYQYSQYLTSFQCTMCLSVAGNIISTMSNIQNFSQFINIMSFFTPEIHRLQGPNHKISPILCDKKKESFIMKIIF